MWPFGSSNTTPNLGKNTEEINKELPPDLQGFFQQENPDKKHERIFTVSPQQLQVNKILEKHKNDPYDDEFNTYKRSQTIKQVAGINCAEIHNLLHECYKNWNWLQPDACIDETRKTSKCLDLQLEALKRLHYNDCYSVKQCKAIRYYVDHFFMKNFGPLGEEVNDDDKAENYNKDLDGVFYKLWK